MLCLKNESNPGWVDVAVQHPIDILVDHAHCEKKAATFAMSMISRYPERMRLVKDMIDPAREEMNYFVLVVYEPEAGHCRAYTDIVRGLENTPTMHG